MDYSGCYCLIQVMRCNSTWPIHELWMREAFSEVPHITCLSGPHPKQLGRSEQSISQWRPKYRWAKVNDGKWSGVTGSKKGKRMEEKGKREDRQRLGPTYNREHERAQNVPQWGPGDGRDRRHHALEPRQPTLTKTSAIHTHTDKNHTSFSKPLVWVPLCNGSDPQHSDCSLHLSYTCVHVE